MEDGSFQAAVLCAGGGEDARALGMKLIRQARLGPGPEFRLPETAALSCLASLPPLPGLGGLGRGIANFAPKRIMGIGEAEENKLIISFLPNRTD